MTDTTLTPKEANNINEFIKREKERRKSKKIEEERKIKEEEGKEEKIIDEDSLLRFLNKTIKEVKIPERNNITSEYIDNYLNQLNNFYQTGILLYQLEINSQSDELKFRFSDKKELLKQYINYGYEKLNSRSETNKTKNTLKELYFLKQIKKQIKYESAELENLEKNILKKISKKESYEEIKRRYYFKEEFLTYEEIDTENINWSRVIKYSGVAMVIGSILGGIFGINSITVPPTKELNKLSITTDSTSTDSTKYKTIDTTMNYNKAKNQIKTKPKKVLTKPKIKPQIVKYHKTNKQVKTVPKQNPTKPKKELKPMNYQYQKK